MTVNTDMINEIRQLFRRQSISYELLVRLWWRWRAWSPYQTSVLTHTHRENMALTGY